MNLGYTISNMPQIYVYKTSNIKDNEYISRYKRNEVSVQSPLSFINTKIITDISMESYIDKSKTNICGVYLFGRMGCVLTKYRLAPYNASAVSMTS